MFARTVPLVLIAAVIACPMWCGSGLCHAVNCCSAVEPPHQHCPGPGDTGGCCDKGPSDSNDESPCDAPRKSPCQGVCGGAVLDKPLELSDGIDPSSSQPIAAKMIAGCQAVACHIPDGDAFLPCGGNYGRSLRTLYMSFSC